MVLAIYSKESGKLTDKIEVAGRPDTLMHLDQVRMERELSQYSWLSEQSRGYKIVMRV